MTYAHRPGQLAINIAGAVLTAFLCALVMGVTYFAIRGYVPQESREFVTFIIGWGTSKLSTVIDWCFGTSSVSKQQQDTIQTLSNTAATAQAALTPATPAVVIPPGGSATVAASDPDNP